MRLLIKNAQVVLPDAIEPVSVVVEGTRIADIDPAAQCQSTKWSTPAGSYLLPGVVDDQVHFREPGLTHKEDLATASRACAKGGVTTFLEMPNTVPAAINQERIEEKLALAAQKSLVNYGFYIGATADNVTELKHARRTPGIKIFIGSSTGDLLVDEQAALERIFAETTLPICAHCEDESTVRANAARLAGTHDVADHSRIRDHQAALIATRRAIDLAYRHHHRFHVLHVSTAAETELLADHRNLITGEACPHHLLLNIDDYARLGTLAQMNPSLKTADDNRQLWQALADGRLQVIATDHAPHTLEEKRRPYPDSPSGIPAVENSLALMLNEVHHGRCTLAASGALDVRRPGPRVGHGGQGPHRRGLRRRSGAGGPQAHRRDSQREPADQMRLEPVARREADRLAGSHLGDGPRSVSRRPVPRRIAAVRKSSSTTPAAAIGQPVSRRLGPPHGNTA